MAKKDPRVDAYIQKAQPFARPMLLRMRELVHKACPNIEEAMKWNFPNFLYQGQILCSMAGFKEHATFGFWRAPLMKDSQKLFVRGQQKSGMGQFGKMTNLKDLPKDTVFVAYIQEAMALTEKGVKVPQRAKPDPQRELQVPDYFMKALRTNKKALQIFEKFSYSHKRDYVEWITEAKTEETRQKRLAIAVQWIAEGKGRNWKYERS